LLRGAFRTLLQTARSSSWFKNLRFLTRSHQHGTLTQCRFWLTKITSFHCLLSKTPSLRKETQVWLRIKTVYCRNVPKRVLRKPCDDLSLRPSRIAGTY